MGEGRVNRTSGHGSQTADGCRQGRLGDTVSGRPGGTAKSQRIGPSSSCRPWGTSRNIASRASMKGICAPRWNPSCRPSTVSEWSPMAIGAEQDSSRDRRRHRGLCQRGRTERLRPRRDETGRGNREDARTGGVRDQAENVGRGYGPFSRTRGAHGPGEHAPERRAVARLQCSASVPRGSLFVLALREAPRWPRGVASRQSYREQPPLRFGATSRRRPIVIAAAPSGRVLNAAMLQAAP
jgi:hypothetical protein